MLEPGDPDEPIQLPGTVKIVAYDGQLQIRQPGREPVRVEGLAIDINVAELGGPVAITVTGRTTQGQLAGDIALEASIEGFDSEAAYNIQVLSDDYVLKRGEAYWVKVDSDVTWVVDW